MRTHAHLRDAIAAWWKDREARPAAELRRHRRPLEVLSSVLTRSLERIGSEVHNVADDDAAFGRCLVLDVQLAVIERLWGYYRDRLGQRDDPRLAATLRTADEITWSCFCGLGGIDASAVPLPFIEPTSTPTAIPRSQPPTGLRSSDKLLADLLRELPLPVIALPSYVVDSPWWLVLLAHEVGHHMQYDLESDEALIARTGDALATAAGDVAARWTPWRFELFADACSVVAVGETAIRAVAELEWGPLDTMCIDRPTYPAPIVRLATMCALATELGIRAPAFAVDRWRAPLESVSTAATRARIADDLDRVGAIAKALADLVVGTVALRKRLDPAVLGPVGLGAMIEQLDGKPVAVSSGRQAARLAAAAAFDRYQGGADPAGLRSRMIDLVARTCDGTTRAGADPMLAARCAKLVDDRLRTVLPDADA